MNHIKLTFDKLQIDAVSELATSPQCGAISLFVGTTRDNFEDKQVVSLEYEAYESMAIKQIEKICGEIREKWDKVENIVVYHRLGLVPTKEASIIIAISSPHRTDAIQATEFCIDSVKKSVTIWKKEIYAKVNESDPVWKKNKESHPPKLKKFKTDQIPAIQASNIPPHLVQIKVGNDDLNKRIKNFIERKRNEINVANIQEFCSHRDNDGDSCARIDAKLLKRKDSKGHLQVSRVLNTFHRDQFNAEYLTKFIPKNGIEERVKNLEIQLSLSNPVPLNIYDRIKKLEERMIYLESISPEYINFWDNTKLSTKLRNKKKIFSIDEIDSLITDLENKS